MKTELLVRVFVYSSAVMLLVASVAKLISSTGTGIILAEPDWILDISYKWALRLAGCIELIVAFVCIFGGKRITLKVGLLAWIATNFMIYRMGLMLTGFNKPCGCFGNLTDALHIPPKVASTIMEWILAYLLIGSYGALYWLWRQKKKFFINEIRIGDCGFRNLNLFTAL